MNNEENHAEEELNNKATNEIMEGVNTIEDEDSSTGSQSTTLSKARQEKELEELKLMEDNDLEVNKVQGMVEQIDLPENEEASTTSILTMGYSLDDTNTSIEEFNASGGSSNTSKIGDSITSIKTMSMEYLDEIFDKGITLEEKRIKGQAQEIIWH